MTHSSESSAQHPWRGAWPVMLTPMHEDGSVDFDGLDALTDWYLDGGVAGLFACCQSSEMFFLTDAEKRQIAARVFARVDGRVPVVIGAIGHEDAARRADAARWLWDLGAASVVLALGEFAGPDETEDALCDAIEAFVAQAPEVSFGVYECPMPYHRLISPAGLGRLARTGRFNWAKETSQNADILREKVVRVTGLGLHIFNADGRLMRRALDLGCTGFSGLAANYSAQLTALACDARQPVAAVEPMVRLLQDTNRAMLRIGYPTSAKIALQRRNLPITPSSRMNPITVSPIIVRQVDALLSRLLQAESQLAARVTAAPGEQSV